MLLLITSPLPVPGLDKKGGRLDGGQRPYPIERHPATKTPTRITQDNLALERDEFPLRRRMTSLLATRVINAVTWKIRTTYRRGKSTQVAAEMINYDLLLRARDARTQSGHAERAEVERCLGRGRRTHAYSRGSPDVVKNRHKRCSWDGRGKTKSSQFHQNKSPEVQDPRGVIKH